MCALSFRGHRDVHEAQTCQVDSNWLRCSVREQSYAVVLSVDCGSMTLSNVDVFAD
jgi:hypothetical protein